MIAEEIFLKAIEKKTPAERAAYLDGACGEDGELRAEVDALIASDENAGSFLEQPLFHESVETIDRPPISECAGSMIGPYKLLEKIGEGGFGVVFMAEQQKSIVRKVALKVIKPGMDTKEVIARFEAERQALALMDHPNIARVLDAGATESGRPYFVMELVRGIPITDYCDQSSLAFRERLDLFTSVCQAVQHAHQKGIIHRDVKPNNVLVTLHDGKPVVKVIDFGVAKAIDRRLTERTLFTRYSEMIGTPLYMSPEQAEMSGLDVDTRTDIYALGVLLYELLTGSTPFDKERLGKAAYDEIRRIIREEEPPRPSTRVSTLGKTATAVSEHRKTEPRKLSALLKGDLDWIVMKALEKDRARRYETAKDFADDVQHYLNDQPVEAHAPSRLYRFNKFVRRYRVAAVTLGLILVTLTVATAFSASMAVRALKSQADALHQKEEADRQRKRAEHEANISQQERDRADQAATQARKSTDDAQQALELLSSAVGGDARINTARADQTIMESLDALAKRLDEVEKTNPYIEAHLRPTIGRAYWDTGRGDEAKEQFRRALDAQELLFGETDERTLDTMNWLAVVCNETGEPADGERLMRGAIKAWESIAGRQGQAGRARAGSQLCVSLLQQGKPREALAIGEAALELERPLLGDSRVEIGWALANLSRAHDMLGNVQEQLVLLRDALAVFERVGDPNGQWHMWNRMGDAFCRQEMIVDARNAYEQAVRLSERQGAQRIVRLYESTQKLGDTLWRMREYGEVAKVNREFLELAETMLDQSDSRILEQRASLVCALGVQGKDAEAKPILEEISSNAGTEEQRQFWTIAGNRLRNQARLNDAKNALHRAIQVCDGLNFHKRHDTVVSLGFLLSDLRDYAGAAKLYQESLRSAESEQHGDDPRACGERYHLGWALYQQHELEGAEAVFSDLASRFQRGREVGRVVWWSPLLDRLGYADALSLSSLDETSLKNAMQVLGDVENEVRSNNVMTCWWHAVFAQLADRLNRKDEAVEHTRYVVEHTPAGDLASEHYGRSQLVRLLCDAGRHGEAEEVLQKAIMDYVERLGDDHVVTDYVRTDLAELLIEIKNYARAEVLLERVQSVLLSDPVVPASERQRVIRLLVTLCDATDKPEEACSWRTKLPAAIDSKGSAVDEAIAK